MTTLKSLPRVASWLIFRFSLGEVGDRHHQDPEGEQYSEPERRSDQEACFHSWPSHSHKRALDLRKAGASHAI
jgi:hypothetical protein